MPKTVQEWYFYHKTKNYKMALAGIHGGVKGALKMGGLAGLFGGMEIAGDLWQERSNMTSTVVAGVMTGAVYSALGK
jgi:hypothetical protein